MDLSTEAGQAFERALQLNPGYAPAHHWYGIDCLAMQGRWDEARHHSEISIQLDPLSGVILESRGYLPNGKGWLHRGGDTYGSGLQI